MPTFRVRHLAPALLTSVLLATACGDDTPTQPGKLTIGTFAAHASGWVRPVSGGRESFEQTLAGSACLSSNGWLYLDTPGLLVQGVFVLPDVEPAPARLTLPGADGAAPQAWVNAASVGTGSIRATEGTFTVAGLTDSELTATFRWTGSPSAMPDWGVVTFTGTVRAVRRVDC